MRYSVVIFGCLTGLVGVGLLPLAMSGCGGDSEPATVQGTGGATGDAGEDSSQGGDGSGVDVKTDCELTGASCANHSDCCSANCDPDTNTCVTPTVPCKAAGEGCEAATECCTTVCSGGVCGGMVCISDNLPCVNDAECCGGQCGGGEAGLVCTPLNPECATVGNACTSHDACCSHYCDNGRCSGSPSFCVQTGDACSTDVECCTGICDRAAGATVGMCTTPSAPGATGCKLAGEVCGAGVVVGGTGALPVCGGECCSRSCAPWGPTGVLVCQPPSGCRPTGEVCKDDSDCCGSAGMPGGNGSVVCSKAAGEETGRCDNGQACRPAGAVCKLATSSCNAENDCCAGNVNKDPEVCQQDLLGIPRCTGVGDCADAGSLQGKECASSADCCGLPCLPNSDPNGAPFICGASCVPAGGACTTTADCCAGLPCVLPPGSTQGVCGYEEQQDAGVPEGGTTEGGTIEAGPLDAGLDGPTCTLYGQECTDTADCCNAVPCTNGRCLIPVY